MTDNTRNRRIVLLDDDPFQLKLLAAILSGLGFSNVLKFENGFEALRLLRECQGCNCETDEMLLFLDLSMPGMDGAEFVRVLVSEGYRGSLVLASGQDERIRESAARLARAHGLKVIGDIEKPPTTSAVHAVVERWTNPDGWVQRKQRKVYTAADLARGISRGELVNYYQPKVCLEDGSVAGVESLVRWMHPADGLVFPDQFISLAEESGLIGEMTRVVLAGALRQANEWHSEGISMRVAVNVSMDSLTDLRFPDFVIEQLAEARIAPGDLVLEVTESRLMRNRTDALEILTRLRLKGIDLSIDDFGTGYSSLSQFRDLPFTELKIDRSFVHEAARYSAQRAIVEANLAMSRDLGLKVVAEGVEDVDDWEFLRTRECDMAQGYFIAKPMPAFEFMPWLAGWNSRKHEVVTA